VAATYKEKAVVLRAFDLGEADRIITLFTENRGLARAVAKGVRRTASKFGARLEPFTLLDAVLHQGRNLDTVVQVETIHSHAAIREDFAKYIYGEAMLEMIEKSLQENQNIPRLFPALCISLDVLEGEVAEPRLLLAAFQLKVCALIGYHPHLDRCIHCGREVAGERSWLDLIGGGIACSNCRIGGNNMIALKPDALDLMRALLAENIADIAARRESGALSQELLSIAFRFSEAFLERPLRSRAIVFGYGKGGGGTGSDRDSHEAGPA
jgi:DNA repair protein RecO (recombination protein O)